MTTQVAGSHIRDSFCGPAGNGFISRTISAIIAWVFKKLEINLERECKEHDKDYDWSKGGPETVDDLEFAISCYRNLASHRNPWIKHTAGLWSMGICLGVRLTAVIYKLNKSIEKRYGLIREKISG